MSQPRHDETLTDEHLGAEGETVTGTVIYGTEAEAEEEPVIPLAPAAIPVPDPIQEAYVVDDWGRAPAVPAEGA